jgi:hypothetical protein
MSEIENAERPYPRHDRYRGQKLDVCHRRSCQLVPLIGRCVTLEPLDVKTLATNVEKRDRLRQNYGIFLLISA